MPGTDRADNVERANDERRLNSPETMTVAAFDHVAIPTARPEEMLRFYQALGCNLPTLEDRHGALREVLRHSPPAQLA